MKGKIFTKLLHETRKRFGKDLNESQEDTKLAFSTRALDNLKDVEISKEIKNNFVHPFDLEQQHIQNVNQQGVTLIDPFDKDRIIFCLWSLLDDIDTMGDISKDNDKFYREKVEQIQKRRHDLLTDEQVDSLYKKYYIHSKIAVQIAKDKDDPLYDKLKKINNIKKVIGE